MIALMGEEEKMMRRHHTPEQIVRKLREADRSLGEGSAMVEVCKHLEVTEQTYYRWRNQYGRDESVMLTATLFNTRVLMARPFTTTFATSKATSIAE
jgi:transposase-like protein